MDLHLNNFMIYYEDDWQVR